jgi:hypothetical protein
VISRVTLLRRLTKCYCCWDLRLSCDNISVEVEQNLWKIRDRNVLTTRIKHSRSLLLALKASNEHLPLNHLNMSRELSKPQIISGKASQLLLCDLWKTDNTGRGQHKTTFIFYGNANSLMIAINRKTFMLSRVWVQ